MTEQQILHSPFNIETHKNHFINYLEVIIRDNGIIEYAIPSHQEKLISVCCEQMGISRQELLKMCPKEYCFDFLSWLCKVSNCVSVWNDFIWGEPNEKQIESLKALKENGIYTGDIK